MQRWWFPLGALALVGFACVLQADEPDGKEDEICASGCAAPGKKYVKALPEDELLELLESYAGEPMSRESKTVETLLFHHAQVREYLSQPASVMLPLDDERRAFLEREVSRTHGYVGFRVIDEEGRVRMQVTPRRVPLTEKQHLWPDVLDDVQPADFNGTLVRVGKDHIWVRY